MNDVIIKATGLSIGYHQVRKGEKKIHTGLSFALRRGELTCLLGPNGAGKSTLLRTIGGMQKLLAGTLELAGRPLTSYSEREMSRQIGLVLTDKTMAGGLTVFDLAAMGRHPHTDFFGRLKEKDCDVVKQALEAVGIVSKADHYVAELSDGERQKAMIARALAQECPVLLLDEPTAFLDVVSRIEIMNLLHRLAVEQGKTILLSTHDLEQALLLSDRLWLLSRDKGLESGITEDLVYNGAMDDFFARNDIAFDKASGSFRPLMTKGIPVTVEAGGILLFWLGNVLMRNGFCRVPVEKDAVFHVYGGGENKLQIILPDRQIHTFDSFAELDAFLKVWIKSRN